MPKSPTPSNRGGSSRRAAPTKVSKPFPWGTVLGSTVLAAALIGIVAYAALNQGSGISDVVRNPDAAIKGVQIADKETLTNKHVQGPVSYPQMPPNGGDHNGTPQTCAVYDQPIAPEHAVHSMEHGAVWLTYNASVSKDDVESLSGKVTGDPLRLMSPLPEQQSPIVLSAWGRRLEVQRADDERVDQFLRGYTGGPQTQEPGAACTGTTSTGPLQGAPVAVPPSPAAK